MVKAAFDLCRINTACRCPCVRSQTHVHFQAGCSSRGRASLLIGRLLAALVCKVSGKNHKLLSNASIVIWMCVNDRKQLLVWDIWSALSAGRKVSVTVKFQGYQSIQLSRIYFTCFGANESDNYTEHFVLLMSALTVFFTVKVTCSRAGLSLEINSHEVSTYWPISSPGSQFLKDAQMGFSVVSNVFVFSDNHQ